MEQFQFLCQCLRCKKEEEELALWDEEKRIRVEAGQKKLEELLDNGEAFNTPGQMEEALKRVTQETFPDGQWPCDLAPLAIIQRNLAMSAGATPKTYSLLLKLYLEIDPATPPDCLAALRVYTLLRLEIVER